MWLLMRWLRRPVYVVTTTADNHNPPRCLCCVLAVYGNERAAIHRARVADFGPWAVWQLELSVAGWNPQQVGVYAP